MERKQESQSGTKVSKEPGNFFDLVLTHSSQEKIEEKHKTVKVLKKLSRYQSDMAIKLSAAEDDLEDMITYYHRIGDAIDIIHSDPVIMDLLNNKEQKKE
jgi:hypothetical protein